MERFIPLHKYPQYEAECAEVLNEEWKRSLTSRLHSLKKSRDSFPMNLILVDDTNKDGASVIGHSRLSLVQGQKKKSCLVESVCVRKSHRGKGYGRIVMEKTEEFAISNGIETMYLTTHDKQKFYEHLGYDYCSPIVTMGSDILPEHLAEKLLGSLGLTNNASSKSSSSKSDKDNNTNSGPVQTNPGSTLDKEGMAKPVAPPPAPPPCPVVPPPCPIAPPPPAQAMPTAQPEISRFDPRCVSWMKKNVGKS